MFLEALKSEQKEIFNKLKYFPEFYLVGGTALALQIGHRISVDFDLFSEKEISPKLLNKVKKIFKGFKIEIVINHSEQLSVNVNPVRDYKDKEKIKREQISNEVNKMKIDFVKYNFSPLLALPKFEGVKFLSVQEIAAAKAYTLGRRITFKDYIDLYFILKDRFTSLQKLIVICKKKYKDEFNERLFLEQLISFWEAEEAPIEFLKEPITKEEMGRFFEDEIKKIKL